MENKWYPIAIGGALVGLGVFAFMGEGEAKAGETKPGGDSKASDTKPGAGKAGTLILPAGSVMPLCSNGVLSTIAGGPARPNFASNPSFQWYYTVASGNNASQIAKKFTGDDRRFDELVAYATSTYTKAKTEVLPSGILCISYVPLKALKTQGNRENKYSSGYNWAASTPIMSGDRIPIPLSWNEYISEQGDISPAGFKNDGGLAPSYYT